MSLGKSDAGKPPVRFDEERSESAGPDDGRTAAATLFDRITTPPKVQKLQRVLYRKAKAEPDLG